MAIAVGRRQRMQRRPPIQLLPLVLVLLLLPLKASMASGGGGAATATPAARPPPPAPHEEATSTPADVLVLDVDGTLYDASTGLEAEVWPLDTGVGHHMPPQGVSPDPSRAFLPRSPRASSGTAAQRSASRMRSATTCTVGPSM